MSSFARRCSALLAVLLLPATAPAEIRYVDAASTSGADDGTSWSDAFRGSNGLRKALEQAVAGDEIWVAGGTYLPSRTGNRTQSFSLTDDLAIYGGFAGGETSLDERDPVANETILSGDLAGDDASAQYADNSYCVVRIRSAVLDGFTITGGNADGAGSTSSGAGIQALDPGIEPVVRSCVIRDNRSSGSGGGVRIEGIGATFEFQQCRFVDNVSGEAGGAAYARETSGIRFEECRFEGNVAQHGGGAVGAYQLGLVYFEDCRLEGNTSGVGGAANLSSVYDSIFVRCVVTGNSAPQGGALQLSHNNASLSYLQECLIAGNSTSGGVSVSGGVSDIIVSGTTITANTGGGIRLGLANGGQMTGSIVYATGGSTLSGYMDVRYSCTDSLQPGVGNIAADPQFVDAPGGNFRLLPTSPCVDAVASYESVVGYDLDRTSRREDVASAPDSAPGVAPMRDMGAYETHGGLFTLACAGDSRLTRDCPCGTISQEGSGCLNSSSYSSEWGATLVAYGTAQPDTVGIRGAGLRGNAACILLQGDAIDGTGFVLGDGLRCIGGSLKRLYSGTTSQYGNVAFPAGGHVSISARSAALGDTILPGERRHYQIWYRDPDPTFCPPPAGGTTNLTSGITMYW